MSLQEQCNVVSGWQYLKPTAVEEVANIFMDELDYSERLAFRIFPERSIMAKRLVVRRRDYFRGLLEARDDNTASNRQKEWFNLYGTSCVFESDEYANHDVITANDLTDRVQPDGCLTDVIDFTFLQTIKMRHLVTQRLNRKELSIWSAIFYGRYVAENNGDIIQQHDYKVEWLPPAIAWSDFENSRPIRDLLRAKLLFRGLKLTLDREAHIVMNELTLFCLLGNVNPQDVGKTVVSACCEMLTEEVLNSRLNAFGLPAITVYRHGYHTTQGFYPFVPDGLVALIARHIEGVPIGSLVNTLHGQSCGASKVDTGDWVKMDDNCDRSAGTIRRIIMEVGTSYLLSFNYPEAVIIIPTGCNNVL